MLFPSEELRRQRVDLIRQWEAGDLGDEAVARGLLELDPEFAGAFLMLAGARREAGDLAEAESLLWKGLERLPCNYEAYQSLSDLLAARNADDPLIAPLRLLGMWKLAFHDEIPDDVAERHRGSLGLSELDFKNPEVYEALAKAIEKNNKGASEPLQTSERLLPYRLLNDLQRQAPTGLARDLLDEIREHADRCAPVWRAALESAIQAPGLVSLSAVQLVIALLGEMSGPEVLDDLLELADYNPALFLHIHWALWRLGQRFPGEALRHMRAAAVNARASKRCGIAEQMNLLPETEELVSALVELPAGFSSIAEEGDAPYLLFMVAETLGELGQENAAREVVACYRAMLPENGRKALRKLLDGGEDFVSHLIEAGIDEMDIGDVCIHRRLMDEEDEDEEELPPIPKPSRNDPCWCGSGKKYKKCHLAADQEAERSTRDDEPVEPPADPLFASLFSDLLGATREWHSREELKRANLQYFDRNPEDMDPNDPLVEDFLNWYVYAYRAVGTGRTVVEEYLRRRAANLSGRRRALLEALRTSWYGLFEVQRVDEGTGIELKDLFSDERFFVSDVSSSRELVQWDCLLNRIYEFDGKRMFTGNGFTVPRPMLDGFMEGVRSESAEARQTPAEFFRANSHKWPRRVVESHKKQFRDLQVLNAEGDRLEFCSAEYEVSDEIALASALESAKVFEDTTDEKEDPAVRRFGWLETGVEGPRRAYGSIEIRDGKLRLECNSQKRLAIGRQLVEKHGGSLLRHLGDSVKSLDELKETVLRGEKSPERPNRLPPEVERDVIGKVLTEHYATWPDHPLPALQGQTPREAVRSQVGRRAVDDLLRMMENGEQRKRKQGEPTFDFAPLRKELGL